MQTKVAVHSQMSNRDALTVYGSLGELLPCGDLLGWMSILNASSICAAHGDLMPYRILTRSGKRTPCQNSERISQFVLSTPMLLHCESFLVYMCVRVFLHVNRIQEGGCSNGLVPASMLRASGQYEWSWSKSHGGRREWERNCMCYVYIILLYHNLTFKCANPNMGFCFSFLLVCLLCFFWYSLILFFLFELLLCIPVNLSKGPFVEATGHKACQTRFCLCLSSVF